MIVDQRKTPVDVVLMLLFVAAASTGSCHHCVAFTPRLMMTREGRRVGAGATGGAATATATARLHVFPSDSVDPMTAAAQVHLQNDHFASSQTTSSVSQDSSSATSIAPPIMARPATESKGNEHKLARVEQQQQQEEEQEEEQVPVWERLKPVDIQGGSQRTWSFAQASNMVEVHVRNPYGNPMHAQIDLWQGPGNTPQKVTLYSEEGRARPFRCFFSTPPGGYSNSINIRNTATMEFPIQAVIDGSNSASDGGMDRATQAKMQRIATAAAASKGLRNNSYGGQQYEKMIQGGATITERFDANVNSVQVYLSSEGRPINCRIELISGPNTMKQVMEVYCEEGNIRPFYTVIETPGFTQGVVRIINTSTMEFPFTSIVQPWDVISTREMNDQIIQQTNHGLGGTSSPFEVSGGYGGNGPASGFGSAVARLGGTQPQQYETNTYNNNNNVRSVGSPVVGMGGLAVPKKRLKRATMLPASAKKEQQQSPVVKAEIDNIDIECTINDDDASDIDIECAVGEIEAKIEAEVDRKMAAAAAEKAEQEAVTQTTDEEKAQQTELHKLLEMKQKLEEQIKTEAEARFQKRLQQEKDEIAKMQLELERVRREQEKQAKEEEEAAAQRKQAKEEEEAAAQRQEEMKQKAAAVAAAEQLQRELDEIERQKELERQQAVARAEAAEAAAVERKQQLEVKVERARKEVEERQRQIAQAQTEAKAAEAKASIRRAVETKTPEKMKRKVPPPPPPRRLELQIDDAFK